MYGTKCIVCNAPIVAKDHWNSGRHSFTIEQKCEHVNLGGGGDDAPGLYECLLDPRSWQNISGWPFSEGWPVCGKSMSIEDADAFIRGRLQKTEHI